MVLEPWVIPVAALVVSLSTLVLSAFGLRQKAEQSYTDQLEARIDDLDKRMKECEDRRDFLVQKNLDLATENARLMRDLLAAKNAGA